VVHIVSEAVIVQMWLDMVGWLLVSIAATARHQHLSAVIAGVAMLGSARMVVILLLWAAGFWI
jgi:hypothetical protein